MTIWSHIASSNGRGSFQGACGRDSAQTPGRPVREGRPDACRTRRTDADDPFRGDEASPGAGESGACGRQEEGPRKAPFPQPGPDQADLRPVGQQVHRALGGNAHRAQGTT